MLDKEEVEELIKEFEEIQKHSRVQIDMNDFLLFKILEELRYKK